MTRRKNIDHFAVAAACRANPGVWQRVGEYRATTTAQGMVWHIQRGATKNLTQRWAYLPVGSFEARHTLTEFGAQVEARFVGASDDLLWADALAGLAVAR
ncbi:hypothetical protein ABZT06_08755 [Streptomyces sp. NPDC005483]|uniref:hypothetical protein n=1 Tax=Streptomyces sp. NPDC005483 TaxID=3154882 RepID=UPI0033B21437